MTEGIRWREWDQATFDLSAERRKPILLDISAVWCHWCHVMDQTTYADPDVAAKVNRDFIPVRVDTDRRPDVNSRYNMGGWPTTAFLTPEGEILTGATYLPAEDMSRLLDRVAAFYGEHETELAGAAGEADGADGAGGAGEAVLSRDEALSAVEEIVAKVEADFDPLEGGFGVEPKFPHAGALGLLIVAQLRAGGNVGEGAGVRDAGVGAWDAGKARPGMVEQTLRAMRRGGLYDHIDGGFFRYSTTRDWSIPHYEKMLEDNAELLGLYARMARLTGKAAGGVAGDTLYLDTVRGVAGFLTSWLRSEQGFFFGSQDADEAYYTVGESERRKREAPRVDRTLYSGWNALAASGFLEAYLATLDVRLRETGLVALEYVWAMARLKDGRLAHYLDDDGPHGPVLLEDYASLAQAFLDAYEATGETSFSDRAGEVLGAAQEMFGDPDSAFYDTQAGAEAPGRLRLRHKGLAENVRLALAYLRFAGIQEEASGADSRGVAEGILAHFLGPHRRHGILAAGFALALDWWLGPTARVEVRGRPDDPLAEALRLEAVTAVSAARVLLRGGAPAPEVGPGAAGGPSAGLPRVLVCSDDRCLEPVADPERVAETIREASVRGEKGETAARRTPPHDYDRGPQPSPPQ